jgi:SAM-dependent methyltransferase
LPAGDQKHDNLQEFDDAALYDAENRWAADDDFYLALALRIGGPVLDLACGTGRLTRAIAARGIRVTGLDLAAPMLARARMLAPGVEWVEADLRRFDLCRRFRLALMTGHAFQGLLTEADQRAALARVAAHLEPGGRFAFETRNPAARDFSGSEDAYGHAFQDAAGRWFDVTTRSRYDAASEIEDIAITRTIRSTGEARSSRIRLKYTAAAALDRLLSETGFAVEARHGDWPTPPAEERPFTTDSPEIITLCRVPSPRPIPRDACFAGSSG